MTSTSKKNKFASLRTPMKELDVNEIIGQLITSTKNAVPSRVDHDELDYALKKGALLTEDSSSRSFKEGDSYVEPLDDGYDDDPYRSLIIETATKVPTRTTPRRKNSVKRVEFRSESKGKLRSSTLKSKATTSTTPRIDRLIASSTPVDKNPPTRMTGVKPLTPGTGTPPLRCTPFTSTPLNASSSSTGGGVPYRFTAAYDSPTKDLTDEERSSILLGITCYVETRNGKDDATEGVKAELIKLGAKIEKNFTRKVTHVVFKEGRMSTYLKAKQWGIPLVSVLWIDACKSARQPVDPLQYRPKKMEKYDNLPPWAILKKRGFGSLLKIIRGGNKEHDLKADSLIEQRSDDVSTPLLKLRRGDDKPISDTKHRRKALPGSKGVISKKKLDFDSQGQLVPIIENGLRNSAPAVLLAESCDVETASISTDDSQTRRINELTGGLSQGQAGAKVRRLLNPDVKLLNFDSETPRTSDDESSRCVSPPVFPLTSGDTPKKRRRSTAFRESLMPLSAKSASRDQQTNKKRTPSLVFSGFAPNEKLDLLDIVKDLGNFESEKNVTSKTTHLVTLSPVQRTVNVVKAISRGCWILSKDWIIRSKECGKWMPEESFELTSFSSVVKKNRLEKQAFGKDFILDLFSKCGRIYVSRKTQPPQSDLTEVLRLGRASLTRVIDRAVLVIGGSGTNSCSDDRFRTVKETWVLDCITQGKTLDTTDYLV